MEEKVLEAIERFSLLNGEKTVTVALSGGADSVALLHILNGLKDEYGIKVYAAHFNHKIRGEEAENDCKFAEILCKSLDIPFIVGSADVPLYAKENKLSLELAARKLRYDFLNKEAKGVVATAHTANDNIETVLFNLTRGTALKGLCGIPVKRDNFVRPMLYCTREEIENYCNKNDLKYVTDSTNLSDDYSRNNIRHNVIPVLKSINTNVVETVLRACGSLKEDYDYIMQISKAEYEKRYAKGKLSTVDFSELHPSVAKRVVKMYLESIYEKDIDMLHINSVYGICVSGGRTGLYDNKTTVCKNNILCMETADKTPEYEYTVRVSKENFDFSKNFENVNGLFLKNSLDCDKIVGELVQRTRISGDKVRLYKCGGTKTLKKLYNEYNIPISERISLPILCDDEGVVWIYGIGVSERCAVSRNTKIIYRIISNKKFLGG